MSQSEKSSTTIPYPALVGSFWLTLVVHFVLKWPSSNRVIQLILGITILAAATEISVIKALELAEASIVGPVHYTLIIWGVFYGYAIFGRYPIFGLGWVQL